MPATPLFRADTLTADSAYFRPVQRDTTALSHQIRMNAALEARVDSLESTLATRVTIGVILLLGVLAKVLK